MLRNRLLESRCCPRANKALVSNSYCLISLHDYRWK